MVGLLHPDRPANNHRAVFAEYASSASWTAVHLGQFAGMAVALGIYGVLQAVDGVALKQAVDIEWRERWFQEHVDCRHRIFVATIDGRVIGYASSGRNRPKTAYQTPVETSVYVAPAFVGRGIGACLYEALLDALDGEDVHRALAGIAQPNDSSVALHARLGFHVVAHFSEQGRKFGRYWDVDWYERALE